MADDMLARPILFLDGGLGTTLEDEHGIRFSTQTPLWSSHLLISSPQTLLKTQTDFARAGADVLLTATYQASFEGFRRTPRQAQRNDEDNNVAGYTGAEATKYMHSAVTIARSAFRDAGKAPGLVALSLGAYGATMIPSQEYTGKYPNELMGSEGLYDFHLHRIMSFVRDEETWNNIDMVAFETLPRVAEIEAGRMVMETINAGGPSKKFWISCVFPDHDELPDGSSIAEVVKAMLSDSTDRPAARPFAIGINCTRVHKLKHLLWKLESTSQEQNLALPRLVVYPDGASGLVYDTVNQRWVAKGDSDSEDCLSRRAWHEEVAEIMREVRDRGAWKGIMVGGCCKTTPGHIAELRKSLYES